VITDGENGLLVGPGNSQELAAAIGELLLNDARRTHLGQAGRARVERDFTFAGQAEQYVRLFTSLNSSPVLLHQRVTWNPSTSTVPTAESASRSPSTT
jgi:glycosyltransferase involved in cell wall biosynthesis